MDQADHIPDDERALARRFLRAPQGQPVGVCPGEMGLAAYLDGRLPEPEVQRLEAHLAQCRSCRQAVAEGRKLLASTPAVPTPALVARARGLVAPATRRRTARWQRAVSWVAAAAAAAAIAFAGLRAGSSVSRARRQPSVDLASALSFQVADVDEDLLSPDSVFGSLLGDVAENGHE